MENHIAFSFTDNEWLYKAKEELDEDEVVFAAERISGRLKRIERKNAKDSNIKEKSEDEESSNI